MQCPRELSLAFLHRAPLLLGSPGVLGPTSGQTSRWVCCMRLCGLASEIWTMCLCFFCVFLFKLPGIVVFLANKKILEPVGSSFLGWFEAKQAGYYISGSMNLQSCGSLSHHKVLVKKEKTRSLGKSKVLKSPQRQKRQTTRTLASSFLASSNSFARKFPGQAQSIKCTG